MKWIWITQIWMNNGYNKLFSFENNTIHHEQQTVCNLTFYLFSYFTTPVMGFNMNVDFSMFFDMDKTKIDPSERTCF